MEENTENKMSAEQPQPPLEQPKSPDRRGFRDRLQGLRQDIVSRLSPVMEEKTTSPSPDSPETEGPPWEGLIFDNPEELTEKVGVSRELADDLLGVHMMNEEKILEALERKKEEKIDTPILVKTAAQIRKYRKDNGYLLILTQEELSKEFLDFNRNQLSILEGIDLADMELVEEATDKLEAQGIPENDITSLLRKVDRYVDERVMHDLIAKAKSEGKSREWLRFENPEEIIEKVGIDEKAARLLENVHLWNELKIRNSFREGNLTADEIRSSLNKIRQYRERTGLTLELSENKLVDKFGESAKNLAGVDLANDNKVFDKNEALSGRITNFVQQKIRENMAEKEKAEQEITDWNVRLTEAGQSFTSFINEHGKGLWETTRPRDWREWLAITARGASDFDSRIGLLLATSNMIAIGAKEIRTYRKLASDLKEKDPQTSTLSEWFSQTTLGKILAEESETDLSKESRRWAGVIGASSSLFGVTAGETAGVLVTAPGASGVARAAILRACTQYVTPRVIDYATSRLGKFEKEEQREEFVNLAIRSSSLTTIFFTTITTGIAVGGTLGPQITDGLENLVESIEDTYEDITEQLPSAPEGEPILEGQRSPFAGMKTDTELPEAATKPTIPQEIEEQPSTPGATLGVQEVSPNEYQFENGGQAKYGSDGNPTEVVLADGRDLLFAEPEDSKGIMGIQHELLKMHKGEWSPDEVAIAAQRLASEGVTSDQSDIIVDYSKPEMPEVLGNPVEEKQINFDTDGDGNPDAHWKVDNDGNIVGGVDSSGNELFFDVRGEGTPHIQKELANIHPDWSPDEVEVAAYRDGFLKGNSPNNPGELESIEKPTIEPQEEVAGITNLVKDRGFDEDGDGIEDSHWLENKETGEIEAGILPDGRVLYLGEEGGITGQVQEVLVHENPNLSPEKVGTIAHNVVVEHEINTSEKTVGVITQPEVISTVNADVARYSLQDYLKDRFNLNYTFAHELAFNKIKLDVRDDSLVKLGPGTEALDFLNARVEIETGIFNWRVFGWKDWLTEQGMLN